MEQVARPDASAVLEVQRSVPLDMAGDGASMKQPPERPNSRQGRTHEDNTNQLGPYPMPKWPHNHQSAAFDAVAIKKSLVLSPAEIYAECVHHGEEKSKFPWLKLVLLCAVAGCYVGFGFTLCLMIGGNMPKHWLVDSPGLTGLVFGAVGFPFAFTAIVVCGAELYTSLCAYMMAAWWEDKVGVITCLRMWVTSWCGNFAGCGLFVGLMYASGVYEGRDWYTLYVAGTKVHHTWGQAFVRGIFANWLVGIATWQANAAQDLAGKAVAVWLPISTFAMMGGLEHCIANQFVLPMAIALGADINATQFVWHNLIPATLGNWVGGAICVATTYAFIFGTPGKRTVAWLEAHRWDLRRTAPAQLAPADRAPRTAT